MAGLDGRMDAGTGAGNRHTPLTREQIRELLQVLADALEAEDNAAGQDVATADGMLDDAEHGRTD